MPRQIKRKTVPVEIKLYPASKTIAQAMKESGKLRPFIERQELTFGLIKDINIIVIIDDYRYKGFIAHCRDFKRRKKLRAKRLNAKG